mmetsp:Transcript_12159/g.22781  ORF Transcript_12159/g.22781 Transcript_12159/m.22781 type:complete len:186 (-) Transcript_12159:1458-2015(-)
MNFREAMILLIISFDAGSVAIGSERISRKYLLSKGKELVNNLGNRLLLQKPFSSKDTKKEHVSVEGTKSDFSTEDNTEREKLLTPFLSSKFIRETTPAGDFSQIVSVPGLKVNGRISKKRRRKDSSSDLLSDSSQASNCNWIDGYGRNFGIWTAGVVVMQLFGHVVSRDQFALVDEVRNMDKIGK